MIVDPSLAPAFGKDGVRTQDLSVAGGLRQYGAYVETLSPGVWTSQRHWHEAEDEFLYVLDGTATVHDDDGMHDLGPGDAVCWRHGDPNAHHVTNRGTLPCRYLIVGSRVRGDVCHYPDSGQRQINHDTRWEVVDAKGAVLRQGDLPSDLLNLPPVWGKPYDGSPVKRFLLAKDRQWITEDVYIHPVLGLSLGVYHHAILGDAGGLSQFGVHLERLPVGSQSSFRHWHETEDELVLVLSGNPTLVENTHHVLQPGDMACWPAGVPIGHCLQNHSGAEAVYLTIGTRLSRDTWHYPDNDLIGHKDGSARRYTHADGTPRSVGETK